MADIAAVFHWSPEVMDRMSVAELTGWHQKAVSRFKSMKGAD